MARLFLAHSLKHRGRRRIILPQPLGKIVVDALVFFLECDCQCQHFAFRQLFELFHDAIDYLSRRCGDNLDFAIRKGDLIKNLRRYLNWQCRQSVTLSSMLLSSA